MFPWTTKCSGICPKTSICLCEKYTVNSLTLSHCICCREQTFWFKHLLGPHNVSETKKGPVNYTSVWNLVWSESWMRPSGASTNDSEINFLESLVSHVWTLPEDPWYQQVINTQLCLTSLSFLTPRLVDRAALFLSTTRPRTQSLLLTGPVPNLF